MNQIDTEALTFAFPQPRKCPFDLPEKYVEARERPGLSRVTLWNGRDAWFVTRYEDFRAVLKDPRFSADTRHPNFPHPSPGMKVARGDYRSFVSMDEPEHNVQRRMLIAEFSQPRINGLRPRIAAAVDELLDNFTNGKTQGDFFREVALPLPSRMICLMLGVPYEAHHFFEERAEIMVSTESTLDEAMRASKELIDDYLGSLIAEKARAPEDDILSRLATGQLARGELSMPELLAMARLLLVAGHDTTANSAAMSLLVLLQHPQQLELLRRDSAKIPRAIEELLRYVDPTHGGRRRVALEDVEISGQTIRAGDAVVAHNPTADRDGRFFEAPDSLNVSRDVRHHVAFGDGIHQCLGQNLARVELEVLLEATLRRLPGLRLACRPDEVTFVDSRVVYGLKALPIAWDAPLAGGARG